MKELEFRVVGLPAPQGSKTLTRYGGLMESSKRVKPWRQDIIHAALEAFAGNPFNEPVQVSIEFIMPRPKSHFGTGKNAEIIKNNAPFFCTSKTTGDVDKLTRSTLDALSVTSGGTVLADDSLVVCLQALKRYAKRFEHIGANINIKTFDKPE